MPGQLVPLNAIHTCGIERYSDLYSDSFSVQLFFRFHLVQFRHIYVMFHSVIYQHIDI